MDNRESKKNHNFTMDRKAIPSETKVIDNAIVGYVKTNMKKVV